VNRKLFGSARLVLILLMIATMVPAVAAQGGEVRVSSYQTGFVRWRAADGGFTGWSLNGVQINTSGELEFQQSTALTGTDPYAPGAYNGRNYYNGGSFLVGETTSPVITTTAFSYKEAIASWNAVTPVGSWVEVQFKARHDTVWSKWYSLGIWASDETTVARHSVNGQGDADGTVYTDTFVSQNKKTGADAFQIKIRLFSTNGAIAKVRNASVAYSVSAPKSATASAGNPALWNQSITIPECSQMVYPDGGEVWCSPTSTSMVLGHWNSDSGACEPRVRAAVDGVYDWVYDGHGNWPFNTAYAATQGYEAYVARFTSLERAEEFIAAGVPVVMSIAWGKKDLTNASVSSTNGHLLVLVGFDASGNPIVNDPAASTDADVTRTYLRSEFEPLWLTKSGGTVYLIYPQGMSVPSIP